MAEQLPCFQSGFNFLNVENSDHIYFIKEIKKLVPHALLSYISTQEFLRIKTLPAASSYIQPWMLGLGFKV